MRMRRRILIAALSSLVFAGPTLAAGAPKKKEDDKAASAHVDIAPVALPVVVKGQIVNYIFVGVRLNLAPMANVQKLREQEPFFRDALVRAAHREPFTKADDYLVIDEARLKAVMLKEGVRIGGRDVQSVAVMTQTPKRRTGVPKPPTS